jgi:hypothetical protein
MIENEKRESWFYATETVTTRANDDASATQASAPSFALDTAVVVIDRMTVCGAAIFAPRSLSNREIGTSHVIG